MQASSLLSTSSNLSAYRDHALVLIEVFRLLLGFVVLAPPALATALPRTRPLLALLHILLIFVFLIFLIFLIFFVLVLDVLRQRLLCSRDTGVLSLLRGFWSSYLARRDIELVLGP